MNRRLLVRGARQLVTLRGPGAPRRGAALRELAIIPDGSLLIEDGTIRAVGPTRRIENLAGARQAEEIDATARVVMPGFVDCHTHLVSGPPRLDEYERRLEGASEAEIEARGGGVRAGVAALRGLPSSRLRHHARQALAAFVRHGTTTIEARTGYGRDESGEIKTLRALASFEHAPAEIVPTFLAAQATPAAFGGAVDEYLACLSGSLLPKIARRRLARFAALGCAAAGVTEDQARRYLEAARAAGLGLKIEAFRRGRDSLLRLGVELGAASIEHLNAAGEDEARLLAGSPSVAVLLPAAALQYRGGGLPPARLLIDSGAAVALATGFDAGWNPVSNLAVVLSLACSELRMTPAEALSAATINAAHALGIASRAGSLECGKQADLLLLNAADYRELPMRHGTNLVHRTVKRGETLYQEGEVRWPED